MTRFNSEKKRKKSRIVYLIISYQVLTDQFLHALLPAVIGWLSGAEQAGGGGVGMGWGVLGSLPEEVSCVQREGREGVGGGRWGVGGRGWLWLPSCCAHGMPS